MVMVSLPALFVAALSAQLASAAIGLSTLAKLRGGRYIGTATEAANILNNTAWGKQYGAIALSDEYSVYTNENNLKWETTEPSPGKFNFTAAEKLFSIAKKNGKKLRGHTLVWHSQLPSWVGNGNFTAKELRAILKRHVTTQASHFRGRVYAWDVVNEAFNEDGTFRQTIFYQALGESYIEDAFRFAHAADPYAKLYYNDYNLESISPKTTAVYNLVKKFKAKGVPIHGVGAQAHLVLGSLPTDIEAALQRFTTLGVDVALTEVDIRGKIPVTPEKLQQQYTDYYNVVKACLNVKRCVGITVWQFTDALSWIPGVFPTEGYGTPYTEDFKRKPAFYAIRDALLDA